MIKDKEGFKIKFKEEDKEFVENLEWDKLREGYVKVKDFFQYEEEIFPIRICLLYSPEEYLFFSGNVKHESWMRAFAGFNNTIYIFAPSVLEKYTIHKKSDTLNVLIHELSHFFYGYCSMKKGLAKLPLWDEGIAEYLADKKVNEKINLKNLSLKSFTNNPSMNYLMGNILVGGIMESLGEKGNKKILEFLMKAKEEDSEEKLFNKFEKVFGISAITLIELKGGKKTWMF